MRRTWTADTVLARMPRGGDDAVTELVTLDGDDVIYLDDCAPTERHDVGLRDIEAMIEEGLALAERKSRRR